MKISFNTKIVYDVHEDYISMIDTFSRLSWPLKSLKIKYWKYKEKQFLKYVDEIFIASPTIVNSDFSSQGFNPTLLENFPLKKISPGRIVSYKHEIQLLRKNLSKVVKSNSNWSMYENLYVYGC